mmetsp:Transcript_73175/g.128952  ORF Transcript_73175/g.128952 Transcript_73175/m.128952 type:complete len:201 (+) Transcript_73175:1650-2252(+)
MRVVAYAMVGDAVGGVVRGTGHPSCDVLQECYHGAPLLSPEVGLGDVPATCANCVPAIVPELHYVPRVGLGEHAAADNAVGVVVELLADHEQHELGPEPDPLGLRQVAHPPDPTLGVLWVLGVRLDARLEEAEAAVVLDAEHVDVVPMQPEALHRVERPNFGHALVHILGPERPVILQAELLLQFGFARARALDSSGGPG